MFCNAEWRPPLAMEPGRGVQIPPWRARQGKAKTLDVVDALWPNITSQASFFLFLHSARKLSLPRTAHAAEAAANCARAKVYGCSCNYQAADCGFNKHC